MRYVIVSVVKGEGGVFNNNIRKDIYEKFKAKSSKLPAHFTIKAPFEYDKDIVELEHNIETFCRSNKKTWYTMDKYDHFDDRVIYMNVNMSEEGQRVHDELIDVLGEFSYINFKENEGKNKIFHVTLSSKKLRSIYNEVWEYVNNFPFSFKCYFDNICIYRWEDYTWKLHREFNFYD